MKTLEKFVLFSANSSESYRVYIKYKNQNRIILCFNKINFMIGMIAKTESDYKGKKRSNQYS